MLHVDFSDASDYSYKKYEKRISPRVIYSTTYAALSCWMLTFLFLLLTTTLLVGKVFIALPNVRMPSLCFSPSVGVNCLYQFPLLILYTNVKMEWLFLSSATFMTRSTVLNLSASGRRLSWSITHTTSTVSAPASLSAGLASTHSCNPSCSR